MDLLERYLQAIGQYLPEETKADVLAELRANLLDQMDARAEELGHALTADEIADILRAHGKPEVVALRYLPQRSLIGPTVYPFWMLTLRRALPIVTFIYFIIEAIQLVAEARTPMAWASGLGHAIFGLIPTLLLNAGVITIVFASIEAAIRHGKHPFQKWDPLKLPAVSRPTPGTKPRSLGGRFIDLTVHCLWMIYILAVPEHPFILVGPSMAYMHTFPAAPGPIWHTLYLAYVVLLLVQLAVKLIGFIDAAEPFHTPLKVLTDIGSLCVIGWLAFANTYFIPTATTDLTTLAKVNYGIGISMRILLVFIAIGLIKDVWKLSKRWVPKERLVF